MNDLIKDIIDSRMNGFVDVHGHLFSWRDIPDKYVKTRAPIREIFLKRKYTKFLAQFITWLWPGSKYRYIGWLFDLIKTPVHMQSIDLTEEMKEANVQLMVVNMMDLGMSAFGDKPEIPWEWQIHHMGQVARYNYGVLMPFVHFDPRRKGAFEYVVSALEKKGFLGVKLYPALGWHPVPHLNENFGLENLNQMWLFYEYVHRNQIPVTVHCSRGGAYSDKTMGNKKARLALTDPQNWERVLSMFPSMRLNMAHCGQDLQSSTGVYRPNEDYIWAEKILSICSRYENAYTDLAYNDQAHTKKLIDPYFSNLKRFGGMTGGNLFKKIMLASDWPMMRHTWTLRQWYKPFVEHLPAGFFNDLSRDNALRFLFPELRIPPRIRKALDKKATDTPKFLQIHFKRLKKELKKEMKHE